MNMRTLKLAAGALVLVALGIVTGAHAADTGGQQVDQVATMGRSAFAITTAKGISAVTVATSAPNSQLVTTTLTLLPGMALRVSNPGPGNQLLLARFSAESSCSGGTGWCVAEIFVDSTEASPGDGTDMAFDSTESGRSTITRWASHSMDRSIVIAPGVHTVYVYGKATTTGTTFWTGERSLTVEQAPL